MQIDIFELFANSPALIVFAAIGLGFLIGNITIKGFQLGSTGGVLISALVFGHFGAQSDPILSAIGFTLFIYSVGLQAGPSFFSVMLADGKKYITLALFVAAIGVSLAWFLSGLFGLNTGISAGVLAGALTSTPTLVGAQNAVQAGIAPLPEGMTADAMLQDITVGYAITYLFGTVGLLFIVKLMPTVLRIDIANEASEYARARGYADSPDKSGQRPDRNRPITRAYVIEKPEFTGMPLGELLKQSKATDEYFYRIKRGDELIEPDLETELQLGDQVAIIATPQRHTEMRKEVGSFTEVLDADLISHAIESEDVVVMNDQITGRQLSDMAVTTKHGCFLSKLTRSQIELPIDSNTTLQKGDVLRISGEGTLLQRAADKIGVIEQRVQETDFVTFAFGISLGLIIGQITVKVGQIDVGLGNAGGLLLSGILVGYLRSKHPTFGRVPPAARHILSELGLLFFMVSVGIKAGGGIVEALLSVGPVVILSGIVITITPLVLGYFFGRAFLKLNPAVLLGALTGAMTSTPALSIVQSAAKSSVPALGYAGTYTFANVFLTLAGTIIMLL